MNASTFKNFTFAATFAAAAFTGTAFGQGTGDSVKSQQKAAGDQTHESGDGQGFESPGICGVPNMGDHGFGDNAKEAKKSNRLPGYDNGVGNFMPPANAAGTYSTDDEAPSRKQKNDDDQYGSGNGGSPISEGACNGDTNNDGLIGFNELFSVLRYYGERVERDSQGTGSEPEHFAFDLNEDGQIDFEDMLLVLGNWGACG